MHDLIPQGAVGMIPLFYPIEKGLHTQVIDRQDGFSEAITEEMS